MRSLSLSVLLLMLFIAALLGVGLFTLFTTSQERNKLDQEIFAEKELLASIIDSTIFHPLWVYRLTMYPAGREVLIHEAGRSRDVVFLHVVSPSEGDVILSSNSGEQGMISPYFAMAKDFGGVRIVDGEYHGQELKVLLFPASGGNSIILGFSMERIEKQIQNIVLRNILSGLLILGFIWGILLILFQRLVRPMRSIEAALVEVRKENLNVSVDPRKMLGRELKSLAETFNTAVTSLKESKERDAAISTAKSEFISLAAHQLRMPLTAIKWVFSGLAGEKRAKELSAEQRDLLEKGRLSTDRMIQLVADLLDVVQIEEGRFGYKFEKHLIGKIVNEVVNDFKILAKKKKIHLVFEKPSAALPEIQMDPARIRIVVENILQNAISYTLSGGNVRVSLERTNGEIQISVSDSGIGIPQKQKSRVFSKFFRAKNAVLVETEGSGLGLYIAKNIVDKHEGRIWLESKEGQGSTFYVALPIRSNSNRGRKDRKG